MTYYRPDQRGPKGDVGDVGPQGPPGVTTVSPTAPARTIGSAPFRPNETKPTLCSYTVSIQCGVTVIGSIAGRVDLLSDANPNPTTVRCSVANTNGVILGVGVNITNTQVAPLTYLVPAGHYVKLVQTVSGTPVIQLLMSTEETLG